MKIYTRTGDEGETGLFGGGRVTKDDARVQAYGELDELNACIGLARANQPERFTDDVLEQIQQELFDLGSELATKAGKEHKNPCAKMGKPQIERLETTIDQAEAELEPLTNFVLPGGSGVAAHLHVARTVCRRAERAIVALHCVEPVRPEVIRYVNRLSDLLFVLARRANRCVGVPDIPWRSPTRDRTPS